MVRFMFAVLVATTCLASARAQDAKAPATKPAAAQPAAAQPAATQPEAAAPVAPSGPELVKQASYGLGLSIGRNFRAQKVELDFTQLATGLRDGLSGAEPALSEEQLEAALRVFQEELIASQAKQAQEMAEANKTAGAAYLVENAKKPGVKATASGLQYKVIAEGTGATPKETDRVTVHYRGTLTDGTVFDSSYERGEPATFPVGGVIPGWVEALQLMKVGSKWQIALPSELAYGENPPQGAPIPPNAVLLFDVELLGITKPVDTAPQP